MGKYDDLKTLEELRNRGSISEEEFQREKEKILNSNGRENLWGMNKHSFLPLMHLSQFSGVVIPFLGFVVPVFLWISCKEDEEVDRHGKNIMNFMVSWAIYYVIAGLLCFLLIGVPMLFLLGILHLIFIVKAAMQASKGEYWEYPMSFRFFS